MKLSFCTNGSMRVLKTCATSGPSGLSSSGTSFAVLCRRASDVRRAKTAHRQGVEQLGDADVGLGRTAENRNQSAFGDRPHDQPRQFFVGWRRAFEVPLHHLLVDLDDRLDQRLVDLVRIRQRAGGVAGGLEAC